MCIYVCVCAREYPSRCLDAIPKGQCLDPKSLLITAAFLYSDFDLYRERAGARAAASGSIDFYFHRLVQREDIK